MSHLMPCPQQIILKWPTVLYPCDCITLGQRDQTLPQFSVNTKLLDWDLHYWAKHWHLLCNDSDFIKVFAAFVANINTTFHTSNDLFVSTCHPNPNSVMKPTFLWFVWENAVYYLLSATMSSERSLSGSTQSCSVVVEIARGIHLVLRIETKTGLGTNLRTWREKCRCSFYKQKFFNEL